MLIYCLGFKKHTDKACPKKLIMMANIKVKGISRCVDCYANKSLFDKIKSKTELEIIVSQILIDSVL